MALFGTLWAELGILGLQGWGFMVGICRLWGSPDIAGNRCSG